MSDTTRNTVAHYSKMKLNQFCQTIGSIEKIKLVLPASIRNLLDE